MVGSLHALLTENGLGPSPEAHCGPAFWLQKQRARGLLSPLGPLTLGMGCRLCLIRVAVRRVRWLGQVLTPTYQGLEIQFESAGLLMLCFLPRRLVG